MTSRFTVRLDGISMTDAVPRAYITDITEPIPEVIRRIVPIAGGSARVAAERRTGLSVTVTAALREKDVVQRQAMAQQLMRWCRGTKLEISTRPGMWLDVRCRVWPKLQSALRWTEDVTMTFTANEIPYWQQTEPMQLLRTGNTWDSTLHVPGTAEFAPLNAQVRNISAAVCNTLALMCNADILQFSALGLLPGEVLCATHDEQDRMELTIRGTDGQLRSAYGKRSAASTDTLRVRCGMANDVALTADTQVETLCSAAGRDL